VLEAMIRDLRFSNELPVDHMWRVLEPRVESVRRDLASEFGCDVEEMAITRNASEANEIMIFGLDLKRGDEVIVTNQNYGRMITAWQQRERREGIVLKQVSFKVPPPSDSYLVEQFRAAITPRTKVIEVTHITNLTGQIMPVRQIVEMARPLGIEVFVDGAHAFAHFPFKRDDLKCDYYGTSLHKWLLAPVGTGFLYVRKDKQKVYQLMPAQKMAMEMPYDPAKYKGNATASMGPEGKFELIGLDTVNGIACTKYKVTPDKSKEVYFFWLDTAQKVPVQMTDEGGTFKVQWKNFKAGAQEAALFEVPSDYTVMPMPNMPGAPPQGGPGDDGKPHF